MSSSKPTTAEKKSRPTTSGDELEDLNSPSKSVKKITREEAEALATRLCDESMAHRKRRLEEADKKIYKIDDKPKRLDADTISASVNRQVNAEMERRVRKQEELVNKHYKKEEPKTLSQTDLDDSVRRIYHDAMRRKADQLRKLDEKYSFRPSTSPKSLSKDQEKECANRLCKPKKKTFTEEEINKILGLH